MPKKVDAKPVEKPMPRLYWRRQKGRTPRAYGNFRAFRPWGGGSGEPLKAPGEKVATADARLAERLFQQRLEALRRARDVAQGRALSGLPEITPLHEFAELHLVAKANAGKVTEQWMGGEELRLERAVEFFGKDTDLSAIKVADVRKRCGTAAPWSSIG